MMMKRIITLLGLLVLFLSGSAVAVDELSKDFETPPADKLAKDFETPPVASRAWCYWWWLNGAASKEGITRDFEEMRKQGISGALLIDAGQAGPEAPRGPKFMSDEWRELYKHAVREADRCGIVLTVNLCSGWNAGGPWVTPEHAAKGLWVGAETVVKGPARVTVSLPKPAGFYRDIAVLAWPVVEDRALHGKLSASSQYQNYSPALAEDGDDASKWVSNGDKPGMGPTPEKPEYLQFDLAEPLPVAGVYLIGSPICGPKDIDVQCSDDGKTFRSLKRETLKPNEEAIITFAETQAKCFRVMFLSAHPYSGPSANVQVCEIAFLSKRQLADKEKKPGRQQQGWDHNLVVDVTKFMDKQEQLVWSPPAGCWKILRLGYAPAGWGTDCVGGGPGGLQIDPMSAAAMDAHFAETGAKLIADAGPLAGKALQYFHLDSWEYGPPKWTPTMREEFKKRRGYDPVAWLPAVLGLRQRQTVDNVAETQRFMQDYRRTVADLVAANYYGRLRELTIKGGLRGTHPESAGGCAFGAMWIDPLQCEGINDIPMGEFWKRNFEPNGPIPVSEPLKQGVASAAHIYGKPVCQAEAFTGAPGWKDDPWILKDIGDAAFCAGITRFVLCFWVHQSRIDAKPGFQWAAWGTHFDCNLTWWPMADGWLTYLARCQYMLRQGLFVADYAYLMDETIPVFVEGGAPAGFDYDVMNAEVLLARTAAKDGRLVLPDGMSYRYLVLPHRPNAILSPATLKKVNELAEAGVTVIDPYKLAGAVAKMREGPAVVRADGLVPDIEFRNSSPGAVFNWIHRRDGKAEIYFISNPSTNDVTTQVAFRVAGKKPELWDAVTGSRRELAQYKKTDDGRTEVPLKFAPRQSFFVVFKESIQNSESGIQNGAKNFPELKSAMELAGAWEVSFDPKWGGPEKIMFDKLEDWTKRPEEGIKFYSGIATYKISFDLQLKSQNPKPKTFLSIGEVKNVARVKLNGRDLGVVWTAPWQVAIPGGLLKEKGNELRIEVANLWPNRLIGDATLPKAKRRTVTNVRTYDAMVEDCKKAGKPVQLLLLPSGLMGPVRVMEE